MGNGCSSNKVVDEHSQYRMTKEEKEEEEGYIEGDEETLYELASEMGTASATSLGKTFFTNEEEKGSIQHRIIINGTREDEESGKLQSLVPMTSFLPTHLMKHLVKKEERRKRLKGNVIYESEELKEEVCILFIDISGFTRLTEQLAKDKHGAENLSKIVNRFFKKLIAKIIEFGGDIERMAGDALISTFWTTSEGCTMEEAINRALLCAYNITRDIKLRKYKVSNKNTLTLHIGLAAGPCSIYHIGGVEDTFWRLCFSKALDDLSTAVSESDDGEIVITNQTYPFIEEHIKAKEIINSPHYLFESFIDVPNHAHLKPIHIGPEHEEWMRYFIDNHSLEAIDNNQASTEYMSGIKLASNVFVTIQCEDKSVLEKSGLSMWDDLMGHVQQSVYSYEGVIGNFLNDEKGVLLFCAFGHPKMHVNDPYRAIRCALEIAEHLSSNPYFTYGIGISTGKVFLGSCGSHDRRDFSFLGDSVNLAARLMKISIESNNSHIITDEATFSKSKVEIAFTTLDPVAVKGKEHEIAIYRVEGKKNEFELEAEMHGQGTLQTVRQNLLNHIEETIKSFLHSTYPKASFNLNETIKGRGYPLISVMDGTSGSGKSQLLTTLLKNTLKGNIQGIASHNMLMMKCLDIEQNVPFSYFKLWFETSISIVEHMGHAMKEIDLTVEDWIRLLKKYPNLTQIHKESLLKKILNPEDYPFAFVLNDIFNTTFPMTEKMEKKDFDRCQIQMIKKVLCNAQAYLLYSLNNGRVNVDGIMYPVNRCVIVLEDLQYMDDKSRELFEEIFFSTPNLVNMTTYLVCSTNKDLLEGGNLKLFERLDKEASHKFPLLPLTGVETKQLMMDEVNQKEEYDVSEVASDLISYMTRKSNGNAQIASLFTHKLLENRFIVEEDNVLKVREKMREELEDVSLPASVSALVLQRIDNLDPNAKLVIKIASIIGMKFTIERLEDVIPNDMTAARAVPNHVNTLISKGFVNIIDERSFDGKKMYAFANQITRDIAYDTLLDDQAKTVHGELACRYVDIFMLKRKTKGYTTIDAQDRPLVTAIEMTAKHFAASRATIENTEYTDAALSVIALVVEFNYSREDNAHQIFSMLRAYMDILKLREDFDGRNKALLVRAAAAMSRKAFILQTQQLDSNTFTKAYEDVHNGRLAAEELDMYSSGDYFTLLSFEWYNNNNLGKHQENKDLVSKKDLLEKVTEPLQLFFLRSWMCISSYNLSEFSLVLKNYTDAYDLYNRYHKQLIEQQEKFTFFKQDIGVLIAVFAARAAFMLGKHKRSENILHDLMYICKRRKDDPSTVIFGMMFGAYQLSLAQDLDSLRYFLDFGKETLDVLGQVGNGLLMGILYKLYSSFYIVCDPKSSEEDQFAAFLEYKKIVTNPDFDANQVFHVNLLAGGYKIVKRLLNKRCFSEKVCTTSAKNLLKARRLVTELIPLAIEFSKSHQQSAMSLVYMYTGLLVLLSYNIDRTYHNLCECNPCDIACFSQDEHKEFHALSSHSHLEPSSWVSRGVALSLHQGSQTMALMCYTAKLKCDLILREFIHPDRVRDDFNSLSIEWEKMDMAEVQMDSYFMRDAKQVLEEASQLLKVHELLIIYKNEMIRHNLTFITDKKSFVDGILAVLKVKAKNIFYYDDRFKEKIPLSDLHLLPNPCKIYVE
mmetsp:Transcript_13447/g.20330  ORF Transcript_13447/g.20330 Transcript_13447/m.20330 type:complete len:1651 (+) Transcript_13447:18-4970(+)